MHKNKKIAVFFWAVVLWANITPVLAAGAAIEGVRLSGNGEHTRLVLDFTAPVNHSLFTLSDPERVVIDLEEVDFDIDISDKLRKNPMIKSLRSGVNNNDLRLVLDLAYRARPKSFPLKPQGQYGHRLVIDLYDGRIQGRKTIKSVPKPDKLREVIIAIDAGHGGKDPGASGRRGLLEKNVTLALAHKLAKQINKEPGMRAVLIRKRDKYWALRDRIDKARDYKADFFVSLHADAFTNARAHGSSVYALSLSGASSEAAAWLADKENSADLIGGVNLGDKDDLVASVLLDLSQTATIQSSLSAGSEILRELGSVNSLHKKHVQQAGFLVLKSPDIPSVLIETAFISNPREERNLGSRTHQLKVAKAVTAGIKRYFSRKAPPGTLLAYRSQKNRAYEQLAASGN